MITIPIEVSNRHLHISAEDFKKLFGTHSELHPFRPISQSPQFAAQEMVTVVGPKGQIERVRIVGPFRQQTQIELSATDARQLGIAAPFRDSGKLDATPGCKLIGPVGTLQIPMGVVMPRRHIHATPDDCRRFGLQPDSMVSVKISGPRQCVYHQVHIKVDPSFTWRLHLDTDEGNAAGVSENQTAEVLI